MCDVKDPGIKLFGKTICLPESRIPVDSGDKSDPECQLPPDSDNQDVVHPETAKVKSEDSSQEELCKPEKSSVLFDGKEETCETPPPPPPPPTAQVNETTLDPNLEKDEVKTESTGQDKVLKKPDKVLPCPRCNSLDTKFCYYNNYNVNQPRHFCKNCQRYWTAGGTMRNVPIGAGRRKNKHMASQFRHIVMSSDGQTPQVNSLDSVNVRALPFGGISMCPRPLNGNGTVLKFGPDVPLCESMTSVLKIGDQKKNVETGVVVTGESGEEPSSCGTSVTALQEIELPQSQAQMEEGQVPDFSNEPTLPYTPQCYGSPWFYPCWNGVAAIAAGPCSSELVNGTDNGNHKQAMLGTPAFCAPGAPFPLLPASYWGCIPGWAARAWNMPWIGSNGSISPSSSTCKSGCSSNGSPTLGKHSRDVNLQGDDKSGKCLWVPKTLRIDDPDEAAKSSIWATLGIKPDQKEPITKGGIFKPFHTKTDEGNDQALDATQVLQANPAALSRSLTFQENT